MFIAPKNTDTKRPHESEAGSVGLAPLDVNKDTPLLDTLCVHVLFIIACLRHQNTCADGLAEIVTGYWELVNTIFHAGFGSSVQCTVVGE